jgi:hypothetical protein
MALDRTYSRRQSGEQRVIGSARQQGQLGDALLRQAVLTPHLAAERVRQQLPAEADPQGRHALLLGRDPQEVALGLQPR